MRISNKEVADLLRSVGAAYILKGKNRFRIIAYENAADAVEHMDREIYDNWENGKLENIPGIGPTIASRLDEYFKRGDDSYLVKTTKAIPAPIFTLMKVGGIGPKRAYKLVTNLKLEKSTDIFHDLLKKAKESEIARMEGFGEKSQEEIVAAINLFKKSAGAEKRMSLPFAHQTAEEIMKYMMLNSKILSIDSLGSLRRSVSTIGDIDLACVVSPGHEPEVIKHFLNYPGRVRTQAVGPKKVMITLASGWDVDLRFIDGQSYGAMLQYNTGSKAHNIKLREYALKKGYSLSEYGIKKIQMTKSPTSPRLRGASKLQIKSKVQNSKIMKFDNEISFYKFLGLQYIPPEIREGTNEVDLASKNKIPTLVELADLKGDFHIHSNYDLEPSHDLGRSSIADLIKYARAYKYEYIAISDHNPSIGNHSNEEIIKIMKKRYEFIKKESKDFHVFVSLEVDILPDGRLALPEAALEYVDMILISIHSSFRLARKEMTKRILKAIGSRKVKILAHPTARLIGKREEIDADWEKIFAECKLRNIAVEINSSPQRLDLPDTLVRLAKKAGLKFAIDTDSHEVSQMEGIFYGVEVARRGWLEKNDIINSLSLNDVESWIKKGV